MLGRLTSCHELLFFFFGGGRGGEGGGGLSCGVSEIRGIFLD